MRNMSVRTLGSWSLILGPTLAVVCYLLQPGQALIDAADPADAAARIAAITSNDTLSQVTALLVPIGLLLFMYGLNALGSSSSGDGEGLFRYGTLLLFVAIIGWTLSSSSVGVIAGMNNAQLASSGGAVFAVGSGIGNIANIIGSLGGICIALGLSARSGFNTNAALIVVAAGVIALISDITGALDSSFQETGSMISGAYFVVVTLWSISLGLVLRKTD